MPASIVFAGIAPHPPLLVPEVGGRRIEKVADSQRALREFSRRLINTNPATIVVISPCPAPDEPVWIEFDQERIHLFDGKTQQALAEA